MANSNSSLVSLVGLLAILILLGIAAYFVFHRTSDANVKADFGGPSLRGPPVHVVGFRFARRIGAAPAGFTGPGRRPVLAS